MPGETAALPGGGSFLSSPEEEGIPTPPYKMAGCKNHVNFLQNPGSEKNDARKPNVGGAGIMSQEDSGSDSSLIFPSGKGASLPRQENPGANGPGRERRLGFLGIAGLALAWVMLPQTAHGKQCHPFPSILREARRLATRPYVAPREIPRFLAQLSYNEYQAIRFRPALSLWRRRHSRFQVQLVPPGLYYKTPVQLIILSHCRTMPVQFHVSDFTYPSAALRGQIPKDLGFAGFKLTYPLVAHHRHNQFLVFAGASYFRGVGAPNNFGLSARGIAINTAFPPHEEFPAFQKFWLVRPRRQARTLVVYALLNGPSLTGAYRFLIHPGKVTRIRMRVRLFYRVTPRVVGVAPLTSMFFYGLGTPRPTGEWRPAVHDSDGLEMVNGDGEWLWRPLLDPGHFLVTRFDLDNPLGFGLVQRDERFANYEDLEARYDTRPSAWIIPHGRWGRGSVELVEIPTDSETVDNIVAYWVPHLPIQPGREYRYNYTLLFGRARIAQPPGGAVLETFVGSGQSPGQPCTGNPRSLRYVINFSVPEAFRNAPAQGIVTANPPARIRKVTLTPARVVGKTRQSFDQLSFLVTTTPGQPLELRAFLASRGHAFTETWSGMLPAGLAHQLTASPGCR